MGENPPFRTWDNVKKPFNKLVLHGEEEKMPKKVIKESKPNAFPHEGVFKYPNPAKKVLLLEYCRDIINRSGNSQLIRKTLIL